MNNLKLIFITLLIGLGLGAGITKMYFPKVQEVQVEREVVKTDVRTVTRIVERKDGTKETITETTDNTVRREDKTTKTDKTPPIKMNRASLIAKYDLSEKKESYGAIVERRLVGPLFIGVYGDTKKNVGISAGIEF